MNVRLLQRLRCEHLHSRWSRLCLIVAIVLLHGVMAGPALAQTRAAVPVLIVTVNHPNFAPYIVADMKGYYREEGLDATLKLFVSGADAMTAFHALKAQFLGSSDMPSLLFWDKGDTIGIAPTFQSVGNMSVTVKSDIPDPKALKGRKIAILRGSTSEYFFDRIIDASGLAAGEVTTINLGPPEMVPALVRGQIDGFIIWRPYAQKAEEILGKDVRVLATAKDYFTEYSFASTTRSFAAENPQAVTGFLRALNRAIAYIYAHPKEAANELGGRIKTDPATVSVLIDAHEYTLGFDDSTRKQINDVASFLAKGGKLSHAVRMEEVFNGQFLKQVDSNLVK
jgi:ABC-type nitrate/sulfonate/bicarbonate transport system substrate-binding protein